MKVVFVVALVSCTAKAKSGGDKGGSWGGGSWSKKCDEIGQWREVDLGDDGPPFRASAPAVAVGSKIYYHGGESGGLQIDGTPEIVYDDLWKLNTRTEEMSQLFPTGDVPPPTMGHSLVEYDGSLIVFGGFSNLNRDGFVTEGHTSYDRLYSLDLDSLEWRLVLPQLPWPQKRGEHGTAVVGKYMYIFGGFDFLNVTEDGTSVETGLKDELWRYDMELSEWTELAKGPAAKWSMSFTAVGNTTLHLMFGACAEGSNSEVGGDCNDNWVYDIDADEWTLLDETTGAPSGRRSSPQTGNDVDGVVYWYGGAAPAFGNFFDDFIAFDTTTNTYFELFPNFNRGPKPPFTAGATLTATTDKDDLFLFGGRAGSAAGFGLGGLWAYTPFPVYNAPEE